MVGPGEKCLKCRFSEAWKTLFYDRFLQMQYMPPLAMRSLNW